MSLLTPKTQLESDLAEKDDSVIRCAEAAHHFACVLSNENARFWAIPTERLIAVLNNDVAITLATFQANTTAGMAVNAILDALNDSRFPTRAPIDTGRNDIVFNGTEFAVIPQEEPPAE